MVPPPASYIAPTSARSLASIETPSMIRFTAFGEPLRSLICQSTAIVSRPGRTTWVLTSTPALPPSRAPVTWICASRKSLNWRPYLRER